MDFTQLYNQLVADFHLEGLSEEDRGEVLLEISRTIQKQFLLDVYEKIGEEQFGALQASVNMGEEFYATTLKHLVPDYEAIFQMAREKVRTAFRQQT